MGWTYHPDELDGLGADAIPVILYELYQAAYERIEAAMSCYLSALRAAKSSVGIELTETDYIDYYLPKYNDAIVEGTSPFDGLPIQGTDYLEIIQPIRDKLPDVTFPVWPNYETILIDDDPETALNSKFWRAVMAWVASYRLTSARSASTTQTTTGTYNYSRPYYRSYYGYYVQGEEGNLESFNDEPFRVYVGTHTISITHTTTSTYGNPGTRVSNVEDNGLELDPDYIPTYTITNHAFVRKRQVQSFLGPEYYLPGEFYFSSELDAWVVIGNGNPRFSSTYSELETIDTSGTTETCQSGTQRTQYGGAFSGEPVGYTGGKNTWSYVLTSPIVTDVNGNYFVTSAPGSSAKFDQLALSTTTYIDLKDVVEYDLEPWYPPQNDPYFAAPTAEFVPYTY